MSSPGEHPGAASGQHHQSGNRVLQQFAPGHGGKISRQVHRAAGSASACCTRSAPGRSGSVRRGVARNQTEASASRCAGEPDHRRQHRRAAGQGGKLLALLNAVLQHAHHGVRGTQGRQPGAMASVWVVFTATKTRSKGAAIAIGSVYTGPGTTISPSSVRSTSAEWAVRPQTIGALPSQTGRRQSWCRWRRDQLAQP